MIGRDKESATLLEMKENLGPVRKSMSPKRMEILYIFYEIHKANVVTSVPLNGILASWFNNECGEKSIVYLRQNQTYIFAFQALSKHNAASALTKNKNWGGEGGGLVGRAAGGTI